MSTSNWITYTIWSWRNERKVLSIINFMNLLQAHHTKGKPLLHALPCHPFATHWCQSLVVLWTPRASKSRAPVVTKLKIITKTMAICLKPAWSSCTVLDAIGRPQCIFPDLEETAWVCYGGSSCVPRNASWDHTPPLHNSFSLHKSYLLAYISFFLFFFNEVLCLEFRWFN